MEIWTEFDQFVRKIFYFTNGKRVVLWGYGLRGFFIQHLFSRNNRKIEYIIDDGSMNPKIPIMRSCEVNDITPDTCAVILSGEYDNEKEKFLAKRGFKEKLHYIFARKYLYENMNSQNIWKNLSYYDYLENKFNVDIVEKNLLIRWKMLKQMN